MRTVVSGIDAINRRESSAAGSDLGFDSIPWELRMSELSARIPSTHGSGVSWRLAADRRPCRARVRPVVRDRAQLREGHIVPRPATGRVARGAHPLTRVQRAQVGFAALAISALVSALAVAGLIGLAQLRSGEFGSETVPVVEMVPAPVR
ncbi:hypothetical protein AB0N05_07850 [Nocardia sp. NPDC051030]|uniref:hypothetical protein n=1 Tax=Nocardia sp. NPDC051030 TaxID=3155162 RepID=UPI003421D6AC